MANYKVLQVYSGEIVFTGDLPDCVNFIYEHEEDPLVLLDDYFNIVEC